MPATLGLVLALSACLAPSVEEIEADRALRAARIQLPAGDCWMLERLPPDAAPAGCVPGPVIPGATESFDLAIDLQERMPALTPDDRLRLGVAVQRIGSPPGWLVGGRMQLSAVEEGVTPGVAREMLQYLPSEDLLIDVHLHEAAGLVLEDPSRENRKGFAVMRRLMDTEPRPAVDTLDALAMESVGTKADVMWANTEMTLRYSRKAKPLLEAAALEDAALEDAALEDGGTRTKPEDCPSGDADGAESCSGR